MSKNKKHYRVWAKELQNDLFSSLPELKEYVSRKMGYEISDELAESIWFDLKDINQ
jgi:hypothetical protein